MAALTLTGMALLAGVPSHIASASGSLVSTPIHLLGAAPPSDGLSASGATPAAAPTLTDPGVSPAAISLAWTKSTALLFEEYTVEVSNTSSGGPFVTVSTITSASTTQIAVGALSPGVNYWWMVVEHDLGSTSDSNVLSVAQPALAYLTAQLATSTTVELNWTDSATYGGLLSFGSFIVLEKSSSTGPFSPVATLTDGNLRSTNITGLTAGGSYAFYLNTTDCLSCGTGTSSTSVTSSNAASIGTPFPLAASVAASRTVIDIGESDLFLCTASGGQSPYTYDWSENGSAFALGNSTHGLSFTSLGPETLRCQVTDDLHTVAQAGTTVTVNADPQVVASVNRSTADVGEPIAFTCSATGGTSPTPVAWLFGDGAGLDSGSGDHSYASAGPYAATCSTTDGVGVTAATTEAITVSPTLSATVDASSLRAAPGTKLTFIAAGANGSGTYTNYAWSFDDGTTATGAETNHSFAAKGDYDVSVRVTDSNMIVASQAVSVNITPVEVQNLMSPISSTVSTSLSFAATATGGAGGPYNYTWNFGDGAVAYGPLVSHAYSSSGAYSPTLTVRDRLGGSNEWALEPVSVSASPSALAWLPLWVLLGVAAIVGTAIALLAFGRSRAAERASPEALSRWVPPVGPKGAVQGAKTCPACGAANSALRRSCHVCGAALPRSPHR